MKSHNQNFTQVAHVEVTENHAGQRLDNFLLSMMQGVPKSRVYQMIRKGEVRINKKRATVSTRIHESDIVRVPPYAAKPKAEQAYVSDSLRQLLTEAIVYEDDALLVVNKPTGLAVHGGSNVSLGLIEALRRMRPDSPFLELAHRLDKHTSGLVMVAKKRSMLTHLHACLRNGRISKTYLALVKGRWQKAGTIDAPLLKKTLANGDRLVRVDKEGKPSQTKISVYQHLGGYTLLRAQPITGRTHQIRVHLAHEGFPILGDEKYGDFKNNQYAASRGCTRLFLHASHLTIPLAGQDKSLRLSADLPEDCQLFCNSINSN